MTKAFGNVRPVSRKTGIAVLSGLALAGCGDSIAANQASLTACGDKAYDEAVGQIDSPVGSLLARARRDVVILFKRAHLAKGSINLPRYSDTTEITSQGSELTLSFQRPAPDNLLIGHYDDEVHFPVEGGRPRLSAGAILCYTPNGLELNGTYQSLQQYVQQTARLGS